MRNADVLLDGIFRKIAERAAGQRLPERERRGGELSDHERTRLARANRKRWLRAAKRAGVIPRNYVDGVPALEA